MVVQTVRMEFFCYHRDRPGSAALRDELLEEHWAYMDRYAMELIARGPTFTDGTATGSVHIVDLPDPAAARAFAFDEPSYQAGVRFGCRHGHGFSKRIFGWGGDRDCAE